MRSRLQQAWYRYVLHFRSDRAFAAAKRLRNSRLLLLLLLLCVALGGFGWAALATHARTPAASRSGPTVALATQRPAIAKLRYAACPDAVLNLSRLFVIPSVCRGVAVLNNQALLTQFSGPQFAQLGFLRLINDDEEWVGSYFLLDDLLGRDADVLVIQIAPFRRFVLSFVEFERFEELDSKQALHAYRKSSHFNEQLSVKEYLALSNLPAEIGVNFLEEKIATFRWGVPYVLVTFYSPTCGYCHKFFSEFAPIFEKVAALFPGQFAFFKIDMNENDAPANTVIRFVPLTLLYDAKTRSRHELKLSFNAAGKTMLAALQQHTDVQLKPDHEF